MIEKDVLKHDWRKEHPPSINIFESRVELFALLAVRFLELILSPKKSGEHFRLSWGEEEPQKYLIISS